MSLYKKINFSNLKYNLDSIKKICGDKKIIAVVKANAYGHGVNEIVENLRGHVWGFAVSSLNEALNIRSFDKLSKVLILQPLSKEAMLVAIQNNVSVIVENLRQLRILKNLDCVGSAVHFKINCGMNRFGFSNRRDFFTAYNYAKNNNILIEGVFTHFPSSKQKDICSCYKKFKNVIDGIKVDFVHFGGSLMLRNKFLACCNGVRVGLSLYGYSNQNRRIKLKPVMSITSRVISVKTLSKGERTGYDGSYIANEKCNILCCALGYADGIDRRLLNKGYKVLINGKKYEIVGKICMDCFFVVDKKMSVKVGSKVRLIENMVTYSKKANKDIYDSLTSFNNMR